MQKRFAHRTEWLLIAACCAAMLCCFGMYLQNFTLDTWQEWAIVLCDLGLYAAVGGVFVFQWVAAWRRAVGRDDDKTPDAPGGEDSAVAETASAEKNDHESRCEPLSLSDDGWRTYAVIFLAMC